jgi:hypothetical protein
LIAAGVLVTVPEPAPVLLTVRAYVREVNVAVTVLAASMVTEQIAPVPQPAAPVHPVNVQPADGVALRVTEVPEV